VGSNAGRQPICLATISHRRAEGGPLTYCPDVRSLSTPHTAVRGYGDAIASPPVRPRPWLHPESTNCQPRKPKPEGRFCFCFRGRKGSAVPLPPPVGLGTRSANILPVFTARYSVQTSAARTYYRPQPPPSPNLLACLPNLSKPTASRPFLSFGGTLTHCLSHVMWKQRIRPSGKLPKYHYHPSPPYSCGKR
jgi:hypothetical protein